MRISWTCLGIDEVAFPGSGILVTGYTKAHVQWTELELRQSMKRIVISNELADHGLMCGCMFYFILTSVYPSRFRAQIGTAAVRGSLSISNSYVKRGKLAPFRLLSGGHPCRLLVRLNPC